MAGIQFAQRMPPQQQQQGFHQQQQGYQQQPYGGGGGGYPQNNHAPQMHMQQHPQQQQQYMQQPNHHGVPQMNQQQQYYPEHDRADGKSAGGEALIDQKHQEIQALRFEVECLNKASDPNQAAAQMAERLGQNSDPFNEDSEWNMKQSQGICCCIQ